MKKLAFIGCGGMGGVHLECVLQIKDLDFEIVGFCDLIKSKAEAFAQAAGTGRVYTDYREMYDTESPDMVIIAIPPYAHGKIDIETAERGIHMLVEKPVALGLELPRRVLGICREKNLIAATGLQCRYDYKLNEVVNDFIQHHPVTFVDGTRFGEVPEMPWFRTKEGSGGQLLEQAIHEIDILRYFFGEVETVFSMARHGIINQHEWPGYNIEDVTSTLLKFKSGLVVHFTCGVVSSKSAAWDSKLIFGARDARCEFLDGDYARIFTTGNDIQAEQGHTVEGDGTMRASDQDQVQYVETDWLYDLESNHQFIKAVIENRPELIRSPYIEGIRSMRVCLAAQESLHTGCPITVEEL